MNDLEKIDEQIRRYETKYQLALIREAEKPELHSIRQHLDQLRKLKSEMMTSPR